MNTENPFQAPSFNADRKWPTIPVCCRTLVWVLLLSPFLVGVLLQLGVSAPLPVGVRSTFGVPLCVTIDHHRPAPPRIVFHGRSVIVNGVIVAIGSIVLALIVRMNAFQNQSIALQLLALGCPMAIAATIGFLDFIPIGEQYLYLVEAALFLLFFAGTWATSVSCNSYSLPFLVPFTGTTIWGTCEKAASMYRGYYDRNSMESINLFLQRSALALSLSVLSCLCIFLFRRKGWLQSNVC